MIDRSTLDESRISFNFVIDDLRYTSFHDVQNILNNPTGP